MHHATPWLRRQSAQAEACRAGLRRVDETIGGLRTVRQRGVPLVTWIFTFTAAVYNYRSVATLVSGDRVTTAMPWHLPAHRAGALATSTEDQDMTIAVILELRAQSDARQVDERRYPTSRLVGARWR